MAGARRPHLTEGQINCLRLVGQNYTSKEIARQLGISPFTVDQRLDAARKKLSAASRTEAARRFADLPAEEIYEPLVYDPETLEQTASTGQTETTLSDQEPQGVDDLRLKADDDRILTDASIGGRLGRLSWIIPPPFGGKRHNLSNGDILLKSINIAFISTMMVAAVIIILTGVMRLFP